MIVLVSMLRGVNVGGCNRLKMAELVRVYASLGFKDIQAYLQSGNLVFSCDSADTAGVAKQIEKAIKNRFGLDTTVCIRTPDKLRRLVATNPFAGKDRTKLHVTFLQTKPAKVSRDILNAAAGQGEAFSIKGQDVFLFLPNGSGRTKLSNNFLEKILGVSATTRNWNTVTALLDLASRRSSPSDTSQ